MPDADTLGRFCWYDLMTTDPDAAIPFYRAVAGWTVTPWEGGEQTYNMWTNGDTSLGGVIQLPEEAVATGAPPHWLAYIATPDVNATVVEAEELGGTTLVPPSDIPTVGRFAVLRDPQGAVFAVFTADDTVPGHDGEPQMGEISWRELMTTDHEAAFDFYSALFGWEKTDQMDMGEMGIYQMYGRLGRTLGGIFNRTDEMPDGPTRSDRQAEIRPPTVLTDRPLYSLPSDGGDRD